MQPSSISSESRVFDVLRSGRSTVSISLLYDSISLPASFSRILERKCFSGWSEDRFMVGFGFSVVFNPLAATPVFKLKGWLTFRRWLIWLPFFFSPRVNASRSIRFYFLLRHLSCSAVFSLVSCASLCFFCFIMNLWILPESMRSSLLPFRLPFGLVLSLIFLLSFCSTTAAVEVISPPIDFYLRFVTEETGWALDALDWYAASSSSATLFLCLVVW